MGMMCFSIWKHVLEGALKVNADTGNSLMSLCYHENNQRIF